MTNAGNHERQGRLLLAASLALLVAVVWIISQSVSAQQKPADAPASDLWRQVEIVRTAHGVPHIRAENLRAAGYALAWLQSEDYGPRTGTRLLATRGQTSRTAGRAAL